MASVNHILIYMASLSKIKVNLIGIADDQWPMIDDLWAFYNKKGIKTVFLNIGASSTVSCELAIAETLGCPIHTWDVREEVSQGWEEVKTILKDKKRPASASSFTESSDTKWVLPKNVHLYNGIPNFADGLIEVQSKKYATVSVQSCVKQMIATMKLTDERIDIIKLTLGEGLEKGVLYALMNSPYRPGLLLVSWTEMPDTHLSTTLCAGHLQTCGYTMLAANGNHFLYVYNGNCGYEICSWETNETDNPMMAELIKSVKNVTS